MAFLKKCLLFCIGGGAYVGLELLWRGYSHISMFAAGGVCFLLIGQLGQVQPVLPWPLRAVIGAGIITMVELAAGLLVNQHYQIWDYGSVKSYAEFSGTDMPRLYPAVDSGRPDGHGIVPVAGLAA